MSNASRLSIIIVTWNSAADIGACLDCIASSDKPFTSEVIVVDNASTDNTYDIVDAHPSRPWLIQNVRNDGVARGCNVGLDASVGDYVLFLRPDMFLRDPHTLKRLMSFIGTNIEYAAIAPQIVDARGRHQIGDAGYRVSLGHAFNDAFGLTHLSPSFRGLHVRHPRILGSNHWDVDWLTGRCLLTRRTVLDRVGGFDERGSLYGADIEWGIRLRAHGFHLAYVPSIRAIHGQTAADPGEEEQLPSVYPPLSRSWIERILAQYADITDITLKRSLMRLILASGFALRGMGHGMKGMGEGTQRELSRLSWRCAGHALRANAD